MDRLQARASALINKEKLLMGLGTVMTFVGLINASLVVFHTSPGDTGHTFAVVSVAFTVVTLAVFIIVLANFLREKMRKKVAQVAPE